MGRIIAIDYGSKRVGIAATDPQRIIASALATVHSSEVVKFLDDYCRREQVDVIVIGEPRTLKNEKSDSARFVEPFVVHMRRKFPNISIERFDERFTSVIAQRAMLEGGLTRKQRRDKSTVDMMSATIILQDYLSTIANRQ